MKAESGNMEVSRVGTAVSGIRRVCGWYWSLWAVRFGGCFRRFCGGMGTCLPTFCIRSMEPCGIDNAWPLIGGDALRFLGRLRAAVPTLFLATTAFAEPVAYLASVRGEVLGSVSDFVLGETVPAGKLIGEPLGIRGDGHICIVLSNGLTFWLESGDDAEGELRIREFEQQPHVPDELIWKVEPSRSELVVELISGQLLVSAPALRDDSDVFLQCGEAAFRLLGGECLLMPSEEAGTAQLQIVSGEAKVRFAYEGVQPYDLSYNHLAGETITHSGRESHDAKLAEADLAAARELLAPVTLMRQRVIFNVVEGGGLVGFRVLEREFLDGVPANIDYIKHPNKRKR